jgi:hypothetical protein
VEVSRATGESVATIRNLRFCLVEPPDTEPWNVDWQALEADPSTVSQRQLAAV